MGAKIYVRFLVCSDLLVVICIVIRQDYIWDSNKQSFVSNQSQDGVTKYEDTFYLNLPLRTFLSTKYLLTYSLHPTVLSFPSFQVNL